MARSSRDFADIAQQNAQGAVQATGWMHAVAEQNLNQSKAAFESLLAMARNALRSMDQQSSAIRERSIGVAEQTLSNAFNFSHRVLRMKDPLELVQIQSDFVSRKAQVLGNHTKELGQRMTQGAHEIAEAAQEQTAEPGRRSEAA
jgi:hypothetical protein